MISNIKLSGVAVTCMPLSFRPGQAVAARAGVVPAARVGVVAAAAAPAERHLRVANAGWLAATGTDPQHKRRRTAATTRVSVDWSPT